MVSRARSVLEDQKVGRRKKKRSTFNLALKAFVYKAGLFAVGVIALSATAYYGFQYTSIFFERAVNRATRVPTHLWQVDVNVATDHGLAISKSIKRKLNFGSAKELARIAKDISATGRFSNVVLYRSGLHRVTANLQVRKPVLQTQIGRNSFLISSECEIYPGKHDDLVEFQNVGFISDGTMDETLKLTISVQEKRACQQLVKLQESLAERNLVIKKYSLKPHSGYSVVLASGLEIVFGDGPLDDKLLKLRDVMSRSDFASLNPIRVDLDYHGKVFIKSAKTVMM
jgi:hypothetical protein